MTTSLSRRRLLAAGLASWAMAPFPGAATTGWNRPAAPLLSRRIPSTGEALSALGLGTWITFNVGDDAVLRDESAAVMAAFFDGGGSVVDSSPMYGSAQDVVGYGLTKLGAAGRVFSADKVWTSEGDRGRRQIARSAERWTVAAFDLLQVHNLLAWEAHLDTLLAMKAAGELRYVGITTSEGRRHDLFEAVMDARPLDFVQVSYNPVDREVEKRILPIARERGIGVIVNRPFRQGALTRRLERERLPDWAGEVGARTWAQLILKFILAEPAVTVAIPATTRVDHVRENLAAAADPLPDADLRERISARIRDL